MEANRYPYRKFNEQAWQPRRAEISVTSFKTIDIELSNQSNVFRE